MLGQLDRAEGLRQEHIDADLLRDIPQFGLAARGEHDHRQPGVARIPAEFAQGREAIEVRHHEVDHHQIHRLALRVFEGLATVGGQQQPGTGLAEPKDRSIQRQGAARLRPYDRSVGFEPRPTGPSSAPRASEGRVGHLRLTEPGAWRFLAIRLVLPAPAGRRINQGEVAEWSHARAWKARVLARVPGVRIPPSPPSCAR